MPLHKGKVSCSNEYATTYSILYSLLCMCGSESETVNIKVSYCVVKIVIVIVIFV